MADLALSVVTPEGAVLSAQVTSVTLPTADGEITVLPDHAPLVSVLIPGVMTVREDKGSDRHLAVSGGFLQVRSPKMVVLADTAERSEDIDLAKAAKAKRAAEEVMASKLEKQESAEASAELQKSLARLRAVELAGHRRQSRQRQTIDQS